MLAITIQIATTNTRPWIIGMSTCSTALTSSAPSPGNPKTVSTKAEPVSTPISSNPNAVSMGMRELRKAYSTITLQLDNPRARAKRT